MQSALKRHTASRGSGARTAVDLFSGCGGLSLGLRWAGFTVIAAIEIERRAAETYRANHPNVALFEADIRGVLPGDLLRDESNQAGLDLLAGCPPCQGYSRMTRRNRAGAIEDDRNNLVRTFAEFVAVLKPRTVMLENVPGLQVDWRFGNLLHVLTANGYKTDWGVVNAADYGVPQRRARLVLLASRTGKSPHIWEVPRATPPTVRDAIGRLPLPEDSDHPVHRLAPTHTAAVQARLQAIPKDGGSRRELGEAAQLGCHQRTRGFNDIYGRLAWDAIAPTITTGCVNPSKGRFTHPEQNRGLTPYEAALLQSFPTGYQFPPEHGRMHLAEQIGNAFPPKLGAAFGRYLVDHIL